MSRLTSIVLVFLSSATLHAVEPDYDAELRRAVTIYPPGDYDSVSIPRLSLVSEVPKTPPRFDLLAPVEPSDKDAATLSSEAASYFINGRWELAMKRYRQLLLIEPGNIAAKAHVYDIMVLISLYSDGTRRSDAAKTHAEMCKQLSKDIIPTDSK